MNQQLMDIVLRMWQHQPMENLHIPPVEILISAFGGVRPLARAISRDPAAVCRWRKQGTVPTEMQRKILELAWDKGIAMTAHEMIFGRKTA